MRKLFFTISFALLSIVCFAQKGELKPRLVVMTDIGPANVEPDDNESAVRLLSYADRFEIEAICTTIGWNCDPYPSEWAEYLMRVVDAYEKDVKNLMKRSKQKRFVSLKKENEKQPLGYWPSAEYIRSRCMMGSQKAGIGVIGEGNDTEGSNFLIKLALEDDPRPIWVTSWGGSNTLAQAIWRYKQTATPEELKAFVRKFRIYTITDQDMQWSMRMQRDYSSHMWLRREFKDDLLFIWDESAWLNQNELGKQNWQKYAELIQNKGALGMVYPTFKWGVEGDTPSFLHIMPNGLNDPDDPTQVSWGGYHVFALSPDSCTYAWTNWQNPVKDLSNAYEHHFYPDEFNDFAARMEWAENGRGNHNPVIRIDGKESVMPLHIRAIPGTKVKIDASKSYDPDGDKLTLMWWQQKEAGTYNKEIDLSSNISGKAKKIKEQYAVIDIPQDAKGKCIHIICEAKDNSHFQLVSYRRIIIDVE